jgi:DHA3 family macrolide efflux protein-like MFS transporter
METDGFMEHNWIKSTILFLSSQTISIFGSFLVQYAILWHITLTSGSGIMMTIYIISTLVPILFVLLLQAFGRIVMTAEN